MFDLLPKLPSGASERRLGFFRFFLFTARTLLSRATIWWEGHKEKYNMVIWCILTISLSSPNLKLSWTTWSSYFLISYWSRYPFLTFLKSQAMMNWPLEVTMAFSSFPGPWLNLGRLRMQGQPGIIQHLLSRSERYTSHIRNVLVSELQTTRHRFCGCRKTAIETKRALVAAFTY